MACHWREWALLPGGTSERRDGRLIQPQHQPGRDVKGVSGLTSVRDQGESGEAEAPVNPMEDLKLG